MKPKGFFHRISELFGVRGIKFDSRPEFSRHYWLQGKNEHTIRLLFSSEILDFFGHEEGWSVEGGGRWLVIYRHESQVAPENLPQFLKATTQISSLFPT